MTELLLLCLTNSLFCLGLHAITRWDELGIDKVIIGKGLYHLSYWTRKLNTKIRDPFTECLTCMASLHSTYFYWTYIYMNGFEWQYAIIYPVYVIILAGLNTMLGSWTKF